MKFILSNIICRLFMVIIIIIAGMRTGAQVDKRLALAEKYKDAGEYLTAANLYNQFLNPPKKEISHSGFPINSRRNEQGRTFSDLTRTDIIYNQAECYRLSNYWAEAAKGYKTCIEQDKIKFRDAFYWFAVCQRSLENYETAEQYLKLYFENFGKGKISNDEAKNELETVSFILKQRSKPDTALYTVKKINSEQGEKKGVFAVNGIGNGRYLFATAVTGLQIAEGVNPNRNRIFISSLKNGSLHTNEPVNITGENETLNYGAASMSPDQRFLYFTQWQLVNGKNVSAIYVSKKQGEGWSAPEPVTSVNRDGYSSKQPFCSADGKTLYFSSDVPEGNGGFDIWYAEINQDGTIGAPVHAGWTINTAGDEQAPFFHSATNTLVFASDGWRGMGGFDLYMALKRGSQWEQSENLGYPVNSSRDDIYFFAPEDKKLLSDAIISSDRGSGCCLEAYSVVKAPKNKFINGMILDCKTNEPLPGAGVMLLREDGTRLETTSGLDGKFSLILEGDSEPRYFSATKIDYKDKAQVVTIENTSGSDWKTDALNNIPICMEPVIKVKEEKKLVIKAENVVTLYFDFDKSNLRDREIKIMDSVFQVLIDNPAYTIQISGYTDGLGTDEYNKKLSDRRARSCAEYLKQKGIEESRISFVSFGKCCPVEMEIINGRDNPDGRSKNRRALINMSKE